MRNRRRSLSLLCFYRSVVQALTTYTWIKASQQLSCRIKKNRTSGGQEPERNHERQRKAVSQKGSCAWEAKRQWQGVLSRVQCVLRRRHTHEASLCSRSRFRSGP